MPREANDETYPLVPWSSMRCSGRPPPILPSEQEAHKILEIFISTSGDIYHFFDQRLFADRLISFYRSPTNSTNPNDLWYIELLLVLAIGQLFSGDSGTDIDPPGATYFLEAKLLLPNNDSLRKSETLGVEILCLMSFYLQCCDQKEDAYINVRASCLISSCYAKIFGIRLVLVYGLQCQLGWATTIEEAVP